MENTAKTSSCLAITEKKTHRPGGCIGIFFQLFDWNRRLAKKKLFSRKSLPPARTKQATKKFKGGEKMRASKIHLIADENRGGFPNVSKNVNRGTDLEHKNEMRVPGLVARLMGLESMPVVNRDKPKKTSFSDPAGNAGKKFVEDLNLEIANAKIEARPLKLQKTGPSERKVMSRIGAEVLQYKSVLSRSRKHPPPPKFSSPGKSPRIPSGRNVSRASRLIDVASKILEPGLQASHRAKCALTHPNSMHYSPNEAISREIGIVPLEGYDSSKSFMGQASCKNCNNLLKVEVFNHNEVEQSYGIPPLNSSYTSASSQGSVKGQTMPPELPLLQERDEVLLTNCNQPKTFAYEHDEPKGCMLSHDNSITERMPLNNESPCLSSRQSSQPFKLRKNESSVVFKHQNQSEDQMSSVRDRTSSRSKSSNLQSRRIKSSPNAVGGTKNFVALNRNLNGCSKVKLPTKVENFKFGVERTCLHGREDFSSQSRTSLRKRRTANLSGQIESKDSIDSSAAKVKQGVSQSDTLSRTSSRLERKALSTKQSCAKSRLASHREGERVYRRDKDIISLSFNSPVRQKIRVTSVMDESMADERKIPSQNPSLSGGDAVAVLEQKLKELTSQEDDKLVLASPSKRSTTIILQELISALAAKQQVPFKGSAVNIDVACCDDANKERLMRMCKGGDHLSPGSVLEASFSSSSVDDSSGCRMPADLIDHSHNQFQLFEPDADLLDSATSLSEGKFGNETVTKLFNVISRILQSYNLTDIRFTGSKLMHTKEVMFKTEVLFGNVTPDSINGNDLLIVPLFIDELETFTCEMWANFSDFGCSPDSKEINHLRGFLFDCLIECLDTKYSQVCDSGFNGGIGTPSLLNARTVIQYVEKEIRKWSYFVGMMTDEIIEWEMSHSVGKWTDFSVEVFESGAEIDGDILQILVEEIVKDLWECRGSL